MNQEFVISNNTMETRSFSWDGPSYSPKIQDSRYPIIAAGFTPECAVEDHTIVASSVTNTSGSDLYLLIFDGPPQSGDDPVASIICPKAVMTHYQFPIRTDVHPPYVAFSSTPFTNTPLTDVTGVGATFWTR